ncbi:MAG: hypothetical protein IJU23_14635 [Proteobacteria bacterium]|nr:hypothetical protein [Pseudomonadota bacterium]
MKYSRLIWAFVAISVCCFGCEGETIQQENSCEATATCKDPGKQCPISCQANDKKCSESAVMVCEINAETQCSEWVVSKKCNAGTHCDDTTMQCVQGCAEICDDQNLKRCGADGVMQCEPDSAGCASWTTVDPCGAGTHCDETTMQCIKACTPECDIQTPAKCENGSLVSCKLDDSGCAKKHTDVCKTGTYCDAEKAACESCKETCNASKRCSDKGVETCTPDEHGCAVWTLTETCKSNQACDKSKLACVESCNPACGSGQVCTNGQCKCDPALPAGWPATLTPLSYPIMKPTKSAQYGSDNIYAPDIHEVSGLRVMWYGSQGKDGHDRIFVAWSKDGAEWRKYPSDKDPKPVLDRGSSNHVNDPSLVHVGNVWKMYYTDAPTDINDRIWLAESSGLTGFKKVREVLGPGPAGAWDADKVGRPAVLYEDGVYKMWYDGAANGGRHVGLATSTDGVNFVRHSSNPLFRNAGAVDVDKIGGVYVMLRESGDGTYWATSVDGLCWVDRGKLFGLSGTGYDKYGQVTPFLEVSGGKLRGVWFGGASVSSWDHNRIGAAYAPGAAPSGSGCAECTTAGYSCSAACQSVNAGTAGACGNPGSTSPGSCCVCSSDGCGGCVVGAADCHQACVNIGRAGGVCDHPGSTDSSKCCRCLD